MYDVATPNGTIWLQTYDLAEAVNYADWLNGGGFEKTAEVLTEASGEPFPSREAFGGPAEVIEIED